MQLKGTTVITGTLLQPLNSKNGEPIMFNSTKKKKKKMEEIAFAGDDAVIQMTYIYNYVSIEPFYFMARFSLLL